jgi:deoxyribonuclease V
VKYSGETSWPTNPVEAIALQKTLAGRVSLTPLKNRPRIVAAIDLAHIGPPRKPEKQVAGIIVYDLETRCVVERQSLIAPVTFPYIPGLLSFREAPAALAVIEKVQSPVDVFLIDGQGLAHPRKFGVACHIGVLIDRPTIGCAKSRLVGAPARELPSKKGEWVDLLYKDEPVGALLRTRDNVKPLYISAGHRITLAESIDVVLRACDRYRLPEPARLAHNYVTEISKSMINHL